MHVYNKIVGSYIGLDDTGQQSMEMTDEEELAAEEEIVEVDLEGSQEEVQLIGVAEEVQLIGRGRGGAVDWGRG